MLSDAQTDLKASLYLHSDMDYFSLFIDGGTL